MRVLSLSGGGYLGLYTARVLEFVEEEANRPLHTMFDLIAGTSIGGIIALGIAAGVPAKDIRATLELLGGDVFSRPIPVPLVGRALRRFKSVVFPIHSASALSTAVASLVGEEARVSDLKTNVIIPAVNVTHGRPYFFKTPHHELFIRDRDIALIDVALATAAAPVYFPLHRIKGELFADGGLFANNPDQIALFECEHYFDMKRSAINMMSIGTPKKSVSVSNRNGTNFGLLQWLKSERFPSLLLSVDQINQTAMMKKYLGDRYLKLEERIPEGMLDSLALDNASVSATRDLLALAELTIRNRAREVQSFLSETSSSNRQFTQ